MTSRTVFVIDADTKRRKQLCEMLQKKLLYHVVSANTEHEAVHYIMTESMPRPDMLLFDVSEIASHCAAISGLKILMKHIPIIALVKFGDYDAAAAALDAGAQDFLSKPIALERMGTTLRNIWILCDALRKLEDRRQEQVQERIGHPNLIRHPGSSLQEMLPPPYITPDGNIRRMEEIEAEVILVAMQFYNSRMTEVARRLGIGRSTLYRKLNSICSGQVVAA